MKPPSGYYRQLLKESCPEVRIAFTHTPIIGCKIVNSEPILNVLDNSSDPHAKFYSDGLKNGTLVAIVEIGHDRVFKNNGELFFTT
jgi:hypothetical protein